MNWLSANIANILIIAALVAIVGLIVRGMIKNKNRGGACGSCGGCSGCPSAQGCGKAEQRTEK